MKRILLVILVFSTFVTFGNAQKVAKEGKAWLDAHTEPPAMNVTGIWHTNDWGDIILKQVEGSRDVTGSTGDGWDVTGAVSGRKLFLLMHDHGGIEYSAELTSSNENTLIGEYVRGLMNSKSKHRRPMELKR